MDIFINIVFMIIAWIAFGTLMVRSGYRIGYRDCWNKRPARIPVSDLD